MRDHFLEVELGDRRRGLVGRSASFIGRVIADVLSDGLTSAPIVYLVVRKVDDGREVARWRWGAGPQDADSAGAALDGLQSELDSNGVDRFCQTYQLEYTGP